MTVRIAVLIVNFNSGTLLAECLRHLRRQTMSPERIIVVDNASRDDSLIQAMAVDPGLEVIRLEQNLGFAAANNLAAQRAGAVEWLALLNPDAFPAPDWLEQLLTAAQQHPACVGIGSRLLDANDPSRLDGTGDVYHVSGLAWRRDHGKSVAASQDAAGEIFAPCAAAALYRRSAFLAVGGFDEAYFCYFEDVDLAFRLRLLGYTFYYAPNAMVHHAGSAITGRRSPFSLYHGHRNLVWTWVKNMPTVWLWLYGPQHLLLNLATLLWYGAHGQGQVLWRAKVDAMRGLPRCWRQRATLQAQCRVSAWRLRQAMSSGLSVLWRRGLG